MVHCEYTELQKYLYIIFISCNFNKFTDELW